MIICPIKACMSVCLAKYVSGFKKRYHIPVLITLKKKQSSTPSTYLSTPVLPEIDFHNPVRFSLLFFKIVAKQDLETMTFFQEDGES
jgi:hypothetical protein